MLPKHDFKPNFLWSKAKLPPIVIALKWFGLNTLKFGTRTFNLLTMHESQIEKSGRVNHKDMYYNTYMIKKIQYI